MNGNTNIPNHIPHPEEYRLAIYAQNIAIIEAHNADSTQTYQMGENQFTDLTDEEFVATYLTQKLPADFVMPNITAEDEVPILGDSADWRGTTPMRNQGSCGASWAFSAAAAIEALYNITKNVSISLSIQQFIDCERKYSQGCNGGYPDKALDYAIRNSIVKEVAYPYVEVQQNCKLTPVGIKIQGYTKFDQQAIFLQNGLRNYPVSVQVDATNWSKYQSGIFSNCEKNINHAVLAVGFTTEGIWIIKNSWGYSWGDQGHIYLAAGNTCGLFINIFRAN